MTLEELRAQYDRLQEAIRLEQQNTPSFTAGMHYASGLLLIEMQAHPDYVPAPRPTCMMCDDPTPALYLAGDWELCAAHYNAITTPDPEFDEGAAELEALWLP